MGSVSRSPYLLTAWSTIVNVESKTGPIDSAIDWLTGRSLPQRTWSGRDPAREHVGCEALARRLIYMKNGPVSTFGHIHECNGVERSPRRGAHVGECPRGIASPALVL